VNAERLPRAPAVRVPGDLAAVVLALAGVRRGHVVLDLTPGAGLCAGAAAAAGESGVVVAVQDPGVPLPPGATVAVDEPGDAIDLPALNGSRVSRALLVAPTAEARSLERIIAATIGVLAPGARLTAVSRANTGGGIGDGLPAVLVRLGLQVAHAEGYDTPSGALAVAVAVPVGYDADVRAGA
jgi:hypothetical protein